MPALDGLRGLAILLVLVGHVVGFNGAGLVGVLLFFVLSGYLITSILLKEVDLRGGVDLRAFYVRRALRLLPALALLLVLLVLLSLLGVTRSAPSLVLRGSLQAMFYVTDFVLGLNLEFTPELAHLWTLAVEEQFYSLWPIVIVLLLSGSRARRMRVLGWMLAASVLLRLLTVLVGMRQDWFFYALPTCWFECLLAGALLAVRGVGSDRSPPARPKGRQAATALCWGLILVAALHPATFLSPITYVLGIPALTAAALGLVACACALDGGMTKRALSTASLRWLGQHSYGLYLYNSTAILVVGQWAGPGLGSRALGAGLALGLAVMSRRSVEVPALRLKGRLRAVATEVA